MNELNSQAKRLHGVLPMYFPDPLIKTHQENGARPRTSLVVMRPANVYSNWNALAARTESYDLDGGYCVHISLAERPKRPDPRDAWIAT